LAPLGSATDRPNQGKRSLAGAQPIQHVVIIFQENRSTDNLFHGLKGADTADYGYNSKGQKIKLTELPLISNYALDHTHPSWVKMYDGGKMDGADLIPVSCKHCPPNPQFKYVPEKDVRPYFDMAEQYAFGDHMFQSNQGPSYPAHLFIMSATSAPAATSQMFVAENPGGLVNANSHTGCTAPPQEYVQLIDPLGQENLIVYPCYDYTTMMDLVDNAGLSWRYYTPSLDYIWTAPNSIEHLRMGRDWQYVVPNPKQVLKDIAAGKLANVTWIMPPGKSSDHPNGNNGTGPSWVSSIVNAVGKSKFWDSTAIFITWDDWGGFFDHVKPPVRDAYEYSFRVPLVVVSPYAKPGYVSHVDHDFSSILKFTETVFNLPSLGFGDKFADDLMDCFNFGQKPLIFHTVKAPYDANYFINDNSPPSDPDED
jgi:phospholipase C